MSAFSLDDRLPRYKYGKIVRTISHETFGQLLERVNHINREGRSVLSIQSLLAVLYWSGFRWSEVCGDKGNKWPLKNGTIRVSKPFRGLYKENIWIEGNSLLIRQEARKHGHREAPVVLDLDLPFVSLILEQWELTAPQSPVWPIPKTSGWRIFKRIDPKLYPHYFCLVRISKLCRDPRNSIADVCEFTGKDPKTVASYMAREGRGTREIGQRLHQEQ